ncbi:hypothetical protein [uncultured Sulfitobacter sp.]|uniref:hypothetical protein n=1 Tax=uncultured Sulfitobacter sp. TaxID=191468 RepID=UPI00262B021A|nr:hypothetical protein [uncultured Sulfitobacter sp.]
MATRGIAADLFPEDVADLEKDGFSKNDIDHVLNEIAILKAEIESPTYREESRTMADTALGRADCDTYALRKVGTLRLLAKAEAFERSDRCKAHALIPSRAIAVGDSDTPEPSQQPKNQRDSAVMASIVSDYLVSRNRVVDDPAEQKNIAKDVTQQRAILAQFTEATQVERGNKKKERQEAGADYPDTLHRTVKQLHQDHPQEKATLEAEIAAISQEINE